MLGKHNCHKHPACLPAPRGFLCVYNCIFNIPEYFCSQNYVYSALSFIEKSGPIKFIIFMLLQ